MENLYKAYGAYARVFIQYDGSLQDLCSKIRKGLNIPALRFENMEDEPYDLIGYTEIFGFEVELKKNQHNDKWSTYQYLLSATTTDSFQEIFNDRMFDISLWMARYISLVCELTTMAENSDKQTGQLFYLNPSTAKRESSFVDTKI